MLNPSIGGIGSMFQAPSIKFSKNITLRSNANPSATSERPDASCQPCDIWNHPAEIPTRITTAAIKANAKFAAGPAMAIHAARLGFRIAHNGSYGSAGKTDHARHAALEIQKHADEGSTPKPNGSWRMWGQGFSVT